MTKMNKELEQLKISINLDCFFCGFILSDTEEELNNVLNELGDKIIQNKFVLLLSKVYLYKLL